MKKKFRKNFIHQEILYHLFSGFLGSGNSNLKQAHLKAMFQHIRQQKITI